MLTFVGRIKPSTSAACFVVFCIVLDMSWLMVARARSLESYATTHHNLAHRPTFPLSAGNRAKQAAVNEWSAQTLQAQISRQIL